MILLKIIGAAIFSSLLIALSFIILPDIILFPNFICNYVKNKKIKKFLEHDLIKMYWTFLVIVVDVLLIVGFVNLIE